MNGKKSCPKTSRPAYNTGSCTTTALSLLARADADVAEAAPREVPGLARVLQQHGAEDDEEPWSFSVSLEFVCANPYHVAGFRSEVQAFGHFLPITNEFLTIKFASF